MRRLYTVESVTEGHPDKVCGRIGYDPKDCPVCRYEQGYFLPYKFACYRG